MSLLPKLSRLSPVGLLTKSHLKTSEVWRKRNQGGFPLAHLACSAFCFFVWT